jgi:hypothetical protein
MDSAECKADCSSHFTEIRYIWIVGFSKSNVCTVLNAPQACRCKLCTIYVVVWEHYIKLQSSISNTPCLLLDNDTSSASDAQCQSNYLVYSLPPTWNTYPMRTLRVAIESWVKARDHVKHAIVSEQAKLLSFVYEVFLRITTTRRRQSCCCSVIRLYIGRGQTLKSYWVQGLHISAVLQPKDLH